MFYVRITNYGYALPLPLKFVYKEDVLKVSSQNVFENGILYGIIILSIIFNTYLWVRNNSSIYYSLYLVALLFLLISIDGYAYQIIWPNSTYIQSINVPLLIAALCFTATRFFQDFFQTKKYAARTDSILNKLVYLLLPLCILSIIPSKELDLIKSVASNSIAFLFVIASIPALISLSKSMNKEKLYMVIAFSIFFTSVGIYILSNFTIIGYYDITDHLIEIGTALEIIFLTIALSVRFRNLRDFKVEQLIHSNRFKQQENLKLQHTIDNRKKDIKLESDKIERQNNKITNSIKYSYDIQRALMLTEHEFKNCFKESFLIYEPKDIVSGDFYWSKTIQTHHNGKKKEFTLIALGDCTGHGIPGALISVLALNTLNQAIRSNENKTTADILNFLNKEINAIFNSNVDGESIRDGLDIAICAIEKNTNVLHYSTAKSHILLSRDGQITKLKTSSSPIGIQEEDPNFYEEKIQLKEGDLLYLLSDGYSDQFGGPYGKKLKINSLKKELLSINQMEMESQGNTLRTKLANWKGNLDQTDDITVIGIKF